VRSEKRDVVGKMRVRLGAKEATTRAQIQRSAIRKQKNRETKDHGHVTMMTDGITSRRPRRCRSLNGPRSFRPVDRNPPVGEGDVSSPKPIQLLYSGGWLSSAFGELVDLPGSVRSLDCVSLDTA